ncbi:MAG: SpoIVB peptidase, partial [Clostridiaceae bacterium]|nr:SpoIVB peptidase [Clostridiaceae bacterium]
FGIMSKDGFSGVYGREMYIGSYSQVKEGKAVILSTIGDGKPKEYEIEITKVNKMKVKSPKGIVLKITDKELLEATGGIVQGMSGSPIIQNGKLVGAVTHVMVNDPSTGYGIFIEGMLANYDLDYKEKGSGLDLAS